MLLALPFFWIEKFQKFKFNTTKSLKMHEQTHPKPTYQIIGLWLLWGLTFLYLTSWWVTFLSQQ
jgi:hypothetical protein